MDPQSLRHLHGLRDFVRNLVEQAERSGGCECHRPPSLLLVGPPGAGKTYLVKQMSTVCEMPLFGVHTHQLSGAEALRNLFAQAREIDYPSLFFLDDIDCIFSDQDRTPSHGSLAESIRQELYAQLGPRKLKIFDPKSKHNPVRHSLPLDTTPDPSNGLNHNHNQDQEPPDNNGIILVAATSSPWLLYNDHELMSRFRGVYLVGLPDRDTRFHLLKLLLQKVQHNLTEKEFWLVADKTEGFTPSDLMIVTKALNYEQFSLLLSMAGLQRYGEESSDEEAVSSSEMTETDIDSNSDNGPPVEIAKASAASPQGSLTPKGENKTTIDESASLPRKTSAPPSPQKDTTLNEIEEDWDLSEDEVTVIEKVSDSRDESLTEKKEENTSASTEVGSAAESAPIDSTEDGVKSEVAPAVATTATTTTGVPTVPTVSDASSSTLPDTLPSPSTGSFCDNRSNVTSNVENPPSFPGKDGTEEVERRRQRAPSAASVCSVSKVASGCDESVPDVVSPPASDATGAATAPPLPSDEDEDGERAFELHVFHPPDPFRNDNQAVDSDSDNETSVGLCGPVGGSVGSGGGGDFPKRSRRVDFCVSSMHPLTVEVDLDHRLGGSLDNLRGVGGGVPDALSLGYGPDDDLLAKDPFRGTSANTILKRLLSTSTDNEDVNLNSKNALNKELPKGNVYPREEDNYLGAVYPPSDDAELIDGRGPDRGRSETDSCLHRKENNKSKEHQSFLRSPTLRRRNTLTQDSRSLTGVSPQLTGVSAVSSQLTGVSSQLTGVSPQLTPTGSDSSSHMATDNSSESGSGRRIRIATPTADREMEDKTRDSTSSLYGKSDTPTIPSSDISTGTCNVSGETLECHSDSDERLRNLEDDLKGRRRPASSGSEDEGDDDDDDEDDDDDLSGEESEALRAFYNLNNLGEFGIKILTVNDVLNVVNRTPKSVSDEEIKRYTDFMVWFANVAKSACPHNSKGALSDTASSVDASSVNGSMWSTTPSTKKRKGPLRKLGHFLLKALMFILD